MAKTADREYYWYDRVLERNPIKVMLEIDGEMKDVVIPLSAASEIADQIEVAMEMDRIAGMLESRCESRKLEDYDEDTIREAAERIVENGLMEDSCSDAHDFVRRDALDDVIMWAEIHSDEVKAEV